MAGLLEKELEAYQAQKSELLGNSKGKFALVKNEQVIDVFDSQTDAIRQGYKQFGNVPFLVKKIEEIEVPENFTSHLLAV